MDPGINPNIRHYKRRGGVYFLPPLSHSRVVHLTIGLPVSSGGLNPKVEGKSRLLFAIFAIF